MYNATLKPVESVKDTIKLIIDTSSTNAQKIEESVNEKYLLESKLREMILTTSKSNLELFRMSHNVLLELSSKIDTIELSINEICKFVSKIQAQMNELTEHISKIQHEKVEVKEKVPVRSTSSRAFPTPTKALKK